MSFKPRYSITPSMVKSLSSIEVVRYSISNLPITSTLISSLRESARIISTHHSTAIEGNKLSLEEVKSVVHGEGSFPHREKDKKEVQNYYQALEYITAALKEKRPVQEEDAKQLHGISFLGVNKQTPYRNGQNVIRAGKLVVYIPPKHEEVPILMKDLFEWVTLSLKQDLPIPLIAGVIHYQFATIHPYFDGNGRTARLLTTLFLHKNGYSLKGIYSLEEYYALNLQEYYNALTIGSDEDYYDGNRDKADITPFLEYFLYGVSIAFKKIEKKALKEKSEGNKDQELILRSLSPQQKIILQLFKNSKEVTSKQIAAFFNFSDRQVRHLLKKWLQQDFIIIENPSLKSRTYSLSSKYEKIILNQSIG